MISSELKILYLFSPKGKTYFGTWPTLSLKRKSPVRAVEKNVNNVSYYAQPYRQCI